jgi:hypothetical protein
MDDVTTDSRHAEPRTEEAEMRDPIHRPGLPYGAILTHGYPRAIYVLAAGIAGLALGVVLGISL